jgi:hypothetical protein
MFSASGTVKRRNKRKQFAGACAAPGIYCTRLARYLFGIVIGLERAGRQPSRHPPSRRERLLYNLYGVQGVHLRPDAGAIDTKMAFTVASLLLGIGQSHGHGSGGADTVIP